MTVSCDKRLAREQVARAPKSGLVVFLEEVMFTNLKAKQETARERGEKELCVQECRGGAPGALVRG